MAEEKKAQKPTGPLENVKVAQGQEKAPESKSEVTGHMSPGAYYHCWNDGVINYVPYGWDYFYCRICFAVNRV